jgi:PB1 domain
MATKKSIKVTYLGETKRIKTTDSYECLLKQTRDIFFYDQPKTQPIRFYYLDEEKELISITSRDDFSEALTIEDGNILKLIVASNVSEARQ